MSVWDLAKCGAGEDPGVGVERCDGAGAEYQVDEDEGSEGDSEGGERPSVDTETLDEGRSRTISEASVATPDGGAYWVSAGLGMEGMRMVAGRHRPTVACGYLLVPCHWWFTRIR